MSLSADRALLSLLSLLRERGYRFTTSTPATHEIIVSRPERSQARDLRDVLGWSLPFSVSIVGEPLFDVMKSANMLERDGEGWKSTLRVSSLDAFLFLHSAYPTKAENSVFFGPDSYRFAALIKAELKAQPEWRPGRIIDVGAGTGVGALVAAAIHPSAEIVMSDTNDDALRLAQINAEHAGVTAHFVNSEGFATVDGAFDLILINPPFMADDEDRRYRDGGDLHGGQLSVDLAREALERLNPGGKLILYTGSAIIAGKDPVKEALVELTREGNIDFAYREIDPDIFGEELKQPAYADVERIAAVAALFKRVSI